LGTMASMFGVDEARRLITWISTTFGIHDGDPIEWVSTRVEAEAFGALHEQITELKQRIDDVVNAVVGAAIDAVLLVATGGLPGLVKAVIDAIATLITALVSQNHRPHLDLGKLDEIHRLTLRAVAGGDKPVLAELATQLQAGRMASVDAARSSAYRDALADGAGKLMRSAAHLRPVDISTDVDDRVLDRAVSEMALWVEQFEKDGTVPEHAYLTRRRR
jgi:hypothetical protein